MPPHDVERGPIAAAPDPHSVTGRRPYEKASAFDHRSRALRQRTAHRLAGIASDPGTALLAAAAISWLVGR